MQLEYNSPSLITIPGHINDSGSVHFLENSKFFSKGIHRCFWISEVKAGDSRGNHAHWKEAQVIVALTGWLEVKVLGLDGSSNTFKLEGAGIGLFIPPLNWIEIQFSRDAILLGVGDLAYSENDFIRDQDYFESLRKSNH